MAAQCWSSSARVDRLEPLGHLTVEQGATGSQQVGVSHLTQTVMTEIEPAVSFA